MQSVVPAEIHEVEDDLLEAAAPETGPGLQKLRANARIAADGAAHLPHVRTRGLAEGGGAVDQLIRCAKRALTVNSLLRRLVRGMRSSNIQSA